MYLNKDHINDYKITEGFRTRIICNNCDTQFIESPGETCPVCDFMKEMKERIKNLKTQDEYNKIKREVNTKLDDSIPKFDLFNMINRKREELKFD